MNILDLLKLSMPTSANADTPINKPMNDPLNNQVPFDPAITAYPEDPVKQSQSDFLSQFKNLGTMNPDASLNMQVAPPLEAPSILPPLELPSKIAKRPVIPQVKTITNPIEAQPPMSEDAYMNKMLREDQSTPQAQQEEQKVVQEQAKQEEKDYIKLLKEAQDRASDENKRVNILEGFDKIGQALARQGRTPIDTSTYENLRKQAQKQVENIKELEDASRKLRGEEREEKKFALDQEAGKINIEKAKKQMTDEQAKTDPNSEVSQLARASVLDSLNKIGRKDLAAKVGNLSVKQIEDVFGQYNLANMVSSYEAQKSRLQVAEIAKATKEQQAQEKKQSKLDDTTKTMADTLEKIDKQIEYSTTAANVDTLQDRLSSGRYTSIDDVKSIYTLIKALDPGSVVRESEVELVLNAQSPLVKSLNMPSRFTKGNLASPTFRKQIIDTLQNLKATRETQYLSQAKPYLMQADRKGLKREEILPASISNKLPAGQYDLQRYSSAQEAGINNFMKANNIKDRNEAVKILKDNGKL